MSLGFKGERGYSAYEIAVLNGFVGSEQAWLAQIGSSKSSSKDLAVYTTTREGETEFDLPDSYTKDDVVEVYVDGRKLESTEYEINAAERKVKLKSPIERSGAEVKISVVKVVDLPIVDELNESSSENTAPSAKTVFKLKQELEKMIKEVKDTIEKTQIPVGGTDGQVLVKKGSEDNSVGWGSIDFLNKVYPVGSIYMNFQSYNPNKLFGGTWERVQDRFLLGSGSKYITGDTGGSETNKHTHYQTVAFDGSQAYITKTPDSNRSRVRDLPGCVIRTDLISTGNKRQDSTYETEIDIMPPYYTVFIWKRIA